jgi:hypothetical protein
MVHARVAGIRDWHSERTTAANSGMDTTTGTEAPVVSIMQRVRRGQSE